MITASDYLPVDVSKRIQATCPAFQCRGLQNFSTWKSFVFAIGIVFITGYGCYSLMRDVFWTGPDVERRRQCVSGVQFRTYAAGLGGDVEAKMFG